MSKKQILIDYDQYHSDLNKARTEGRSQKAHEKEAKYKIGHSVHLNGWDGVFRILGVKFSKKYGYLLFNKPSRSMD